MAGERRVTHMPEPESGLLPYAFKYSSAAIQSRKDLPQEMLPALFEVIEMLAEDPDARPDRTRPVSRDGSISVYMHPRPPLQVTYEVDRKKRMLYLLSFVAQSVQVAQPVFISYCREDAEWLTKLKMSWQPLEQRHLIRIWDDTAIRAGSDYLKEIRQALDSARVAVLLVTENFLNSEFIRAEELPRLLEKAKEGGCTIFWIAVSGPPVANPNITRYQAANDRERPLAKLGEAEQKSALRDISDRLRETVEGS